MRNIELKARLHNPEEAISVCQEIRASFQDVITQRDTYFPVPVGRLKLRESNRGDNYLVYYRRPDTAKAKACDYSIEPVNRSLREILVEALGTLAVVEKRRMLFLWKNVRIHIDDLEGFGSFIEFEAVLSDRFDDEDGYAKVTRLRKRFEIATKDLIKTSYLDLILAAQAATGPGRG